MADTSIWKIMGTSFLITLGLLFLAQFAAGLAPT
jgi:hypothetical protein